MLRLKRYLILINLWEAPNLNKIKRRSYYQTKKNCFRGFAVQIYFEFDQTAILVRIKRISSPQIADKPINDL